MALIAFGGNCFHKALSYMTSIILVSSVGLVLAIMLQMVGFCGIW